MSKIYARLIKKKLMTIEEVPPEIRDEVQNYYRTYGGKGNEIEYSNNLRTWTGTEQT